MPVRQCSAADLLALTGNDPFVRAQSRYRFGTAWHDGRGSVAFVGLDAEENVRHLAAIGGPPRVAELAATAVREVPEVPRLSVPRGTLGYLPAWLAIEGATDWDFRSTVAFPPHQPGEDRVGWLDGADAGDVKELLVAANPGSSVWPGEPKVRRWAGIRDAAGELEACLADTSGADGTGHVSGIATRPDSRGQGLSSAITAWATRRLLEQGCDIVSLGVYADNAAARRVYDRLGFTDEHHFTSGALVSTHRPEQPEDWREAARCPDC